MTSRKDLDAAGTFRSRNNNVVMMKLFNVIAASWHNVSCSSWTDDGEVTLSSCAWSWLVEVVSDGIIPMRSMSCCIRLRLSIRRRWYGFVCFVCSSKMCVDHNLDSSRWRYERICVLVRVFVKKGVWGLLKLRKNVVCCYKNTGVTTTKCERVWYKVYTKNKCEICCVPSRVSLYSYYKLCLYCFFSFPLKWESFGVFTKINDGGCGREGFGKRESLFTFFRSPSQNESFACLSEFANFDSYRSNEQPSFDWTAVPL